jgi:isoleucyl-tRNA synthetase
VGASLQASVNLQVGTEDHALLASLGNDLKFVFITSQLNLEEGSELVAKVSVSQDTKCERCWHYSPDVGVNPAHPTLCGRCDSNLHGAGEKRLFA